MSIEGKIESKKDEFSSLVGLTQNQIKSFIKTKGKKFDDDLSNKFKESIKLIQDNIDAKEDYQIKKWSKEDYDKIPEKFPNTADDLASNYLPVLLHWFIATLDSQFNTQKRPYEWFLPARHKDAGALGFPARYSLNDGSLVAGRYESKNERESITVGITADWASGTQESFHVAKYLANQENDFNLHLGDIYFTGTLNDCKQNFCEAVQFPWGKLGAFAISGNHEAYSNCIGFRKVIMPFCGSTNGGTQRTPFWSLESNHWIMLGLDTGYNSVDFNLWNPINNTEGANSEMKLPEQIMSWLKANFANPDDKRGIIIMTHHMPISPHDNEPVFAEIANQLATIFNGRTVVWLWGHLHNFIVYKKQIWSYQSSTFNFFARCIGHGGFPVTNQGKQKDELIKAVKKYQEQIQVVDHGIGWNKKYGRNGYVRVTFNGPKATLDYYLLGGKRDKPEVQHIINESFTNSSEKSSSIESTEFKFMPKIKLNDFTIFKNDDPNAAVTALTKQIPAPVACGCSIM
jgi:predicted phosphohydrolase